MTSTPEERLREAFARRASGVEPAPGALFEIQRRISRTRRGPELRRRPRLRPALVLAAAACGLAIALVSVALTRTSPEPTGEIATPVASQPDRPTTAPAADPAPAGGQPAAAPPDAAPQAPAGDDGTGIATELPPPPGPSSPPAADPAPAGAQPAAQPPAADDPPSAQPASPPGTPPPPAEPDDPPSDGTAEGDPDDTALAAADAGATPACAPQPANPADPDGEPAAAWVTVYFACGDADAAPRRKAAAGGDLNSALAALMAGPDEADAGSGFRGLQHAAAGTPAWAAVPTTDAAWVTIDFPADLADGFGGVTPEQFVTQLNRTVFEFADIAVAEYRLAGSCAAFGGLLGRPCEVHMRQARHVSELAVATIGTQRLVIRSEPNSTAMESGRANTGTRLIGRVTTDWAQVITTAGELGWVSTLHLRAQPLGLSPAAAAAMENLARAVTTGPGLARSGFSPAGILVRWGIDGADVTWIATTGGGAASDWWYAERNIPEPRGPDPQPTTSLAELLWIDGSVGSGALVEIDTPGQLGPPHADFAGLAYVSVYQPAASGSTLPPSLAGDPALPPLDDTDLPPPLPGLEDPGGEPPVAALVRVMFDFTSPEEPRVAALQVIWG